MDRFSEEDCKYMYRCLQLARCGAGSTSPNPMVGAVIVCDGRVRQASFGAFDHICKS